MVVLFMIYQTLLRILIIHLKTSCMCFCVFLLFQYKLLSHTNSIRAASAVQPQFEVFLLFHRRPEPKDDGPLRISYITNVYSKKKWDCKLISQSDSPTRLYKSFSKKEIENIKGYSKLTVKQVWLFFFFLLQLLKIRLLFSLFLKD